MSKEYHIENFDRFARAENEREQIRIYLSSISKISFQSQIRILKIIRVFPRVGVKFKGFQSRGLEQRGSGETVSFIRI